MYTVDITGPAPLVEYPGLVEHLRRHYPDYDDIKLVNVLFAMKAYPVAEYLARQFYKIDVSDG